MSSLVLGIDIGYSEKRTTTGACLLKWTDTEVVAECKRLPTAADVRKQRITELFAGRIAVAVSIDAPIRGGLDLIGEYRDAEMMLTRGFQPIIGKPGQASSGNGKRLNESANSIARAIIELGAVQQSMHKAKIHDFAIVEAFPTGFLGVLLSHDGVPAHGARSDAYFEHLLGPDSSQPKPPTTNVVREMISRLLPNRELKLNLESFRHHEDRAALICALTALSVAMHDYVAVGDGKNGYIILPGRTRDGGVGLQPWAWEMLVKNRPTGAKDSLIVEPD